MNLKKTVAMLAIIAATGLFAGMQNVDNLVTKLNKTTDATKKVQLLKELDTELSKMSIVEQQKANVIINAKLKKQLKAK